MNRNDLTNVNFNDISGHPMTFHIEPMPLEPTKFVDSEQCRLTDKEIQQYIQTQQQSLNSMIESEVRNFKSNLTKKLQEANKTIKSDFVSIQNTLNSAEAEVSAFEKEIEIYHQGVKDFNLIQHVRIYVVDWGVPLMLGGLSLYLNVDSVILFIKEIGSKLI